MISVTKILCVAVIASADEVARDMEGARKLLTKRALEGVAERELEEDRELCNCDIVCGDSSSCKVHTRRHCDNYSKKNKGCTGSCSKGKKKGGACRLIHFRQLGELEEDILKNIMLV